MPILWQCLNQGPYLSTADHGAKISRTIIVCRNYFHYVQKCQREVVHLLCYDFSSHLWGFGNISLFLLDLGVRGGTLILQHWYPPTSFGRRWPCLPRQCKSLSHILCGRLQHDPIIFVNIAVYLLIIIGLRFGCYSSRFALYVGLRLFLLIAINLIVYNVNAGHWQRLFDSMSWWLSQLDQKVVGRRPLQPCEPCLDALKSFVFCGRLMLFQAALLDS